MFQMIRVNMLPEKTLCFKFQVKPRKAEVTHILKGRLSGAGQRAVASFQRQVTALSCSQKRRGKPKFIACTLYISRFHQILSTVFLTFFFFIV